MLNIPQRVKDLYLQESVHKIVQILFPNGEAVTLSNPDMIAESLRMTESICSEEFFRFGLAERSVLEFEAVGYPDIKGAALQVYLQISLESLTAAEISTIRRGSWDGSLVLVDGVNYFQIPLGAYVVDQCPVQNDYNYRRSVRAFTADYFNAVNEFEQTKLSLPLPAAGWTYRPLIAQLVMAQLAYQNDQPLIAAGYRKQLISGWTEAQPTFQGLKIAVVNSSGQTLNLTMTECKTRYARGGTGVSTVEYDADAIRAWLLALDTYLDTLNIDYSAGATIADTVQVPLSEASDLRELLGQQFQIYNGVEYSGSGYKEETYNVLRPFIFFRSRYDPEGTPSIVRLLDIVSGSTGYVAYYPGGLEYLNTYGAFAFPYSYTLTVQNTTAGTTETHSDTVSLNIFEYQYTGDTSTQDLSTKRLTFEPNGDEVGVSNWIGTYNMGQIINNYLEVMAYFASPSRYGSAKLFRLPTAVQQTVQASAYAALSVDEHNGRLPGMIRFTALNGGEQTLVEYRFGNGQAVYDMSDNSLFIDVGMSSDDAKTFLQTYFVPYIQSLALNAADAAAIGMPWIEPGDLLSFTRPGGETVEIYATRRNMRGPQMLQDEIEAVRTPTTGE